MKKHFKTNAFTPQSVSFGDGPNYETLVSVFGSMLSELGRGVILEALESRRPEFSDHNTMNMPTDNVAI